MIRLTANAAATEPLCRAPAVCEASSVTTSTFLVSTSDVLENPGHNISIGPVVSRYATV